jgi:hypothetical protein
LTDMAEQLSAIQNIRYRWLITPAGLSDVAGLAEVYTRLDWSLIATDEKTNAESRIDMGSVYLPPPDKTSFVERAKVSPELLKAWLLNGLDPNAIETCKRLAVMRLASFVGEPVEVEG